MKIRRLVTFGALSCLLAAAALLLGCSGQSGQGVSEEARALEDTVRRYNTALAEGFRDQDMGALESVATTDQAYTEYLQMEALGEAGIRMEADLVELSVVEVAVSDDDTAQVLTDETWNYRHVSMESGEVARKEDGVAYLLTYTLVRRDGVWLVDTVKETTESGEATPSP